MTKTVKLVEIEGTTSVYIDAAIDEAGDVVFSGQDVGEAPRMYVNDSDYEYWLTVPAHEKDRFLMSLIEKLYLNNPEVISDVRKLLEDSGISYSSHSF